MESTIVNVKYDPNDHWFELVLENGDVIRYDTSHTLHQVRINPQPQDRGDYDPDEKPEDEISDDKK